MTLGPTAGAYVFEAAAASLGVVTANATATAAPASAIAVAGGNFQGVVAGSLLPAPLTVVVTNRFGAPVAGATALPRLAG